MGGSVGLKGTDGREIMEEALRRGAHPVAPKRSVRALIALKQDVPNLKILCCPGEMGEDEARAAQIECKLLRLDIEQPTTSADTQLVARTLEESGARLILFAGGDGTARDISQTVETRIAVLGIPCGVKNYSAVFAKSPEAAGHVAASFLLNEISTLDCEVLDFDENQMRQDYISTKVRGLLRVPSLRRFMQGAKSTSYTSDDEAEQNAIAKFIAEEMNSQFQYILGPGSTTSKVAQLLGVMKTVLGVDIIFQKRLVARDVTSSDLERRIGDHSTKLIITPIGGQGYILGRGNQQLTPAVIRAIGKENIIVVCTRSKLLNLPDREFFVDTGDVALDHELCGYWRAVVGYREFTVVRVGM
jgi:predicted polyphosphate/ATP-dependent NAD kinase